jgi:hypothetical protein
MSEAVIRASERGTAVRSAHPRGDNIVADRSGGAERNEGAIARRNQSSVVAGSASCRVNARIALLIFTGGWRHNVPVDPSRRDGSSRGAGRPA